LLGEFFIYSALFGSPDFGYELDFVGFLARPRRDLLPACPARGGAWYTKPTLSKGNPMTTLPQETLELIVDVMTLYHSGIVNYEEFASERAIEEARIIRKRTDELKKRLVPGIEAVRQAKLEWLARIAGAG
jgi:hypothetical protein